MTSLITLGINKLKATSPLHLLWVTVVLAEIITLTVVASLSVFFHGRITHDYLITGGIAAFLTSLILTYMLVYFINIIREREKLSLKEIYDHKQTEEMLRKSEDNYKNLLQEFNVLLDAIPDVLLLLSPDLKVQWANKGASLRLGKEAFKLTGQYCYELWHKCSVPCDKCHVLKSFRTGDIAISQSLTNDNRFWDVRAFPVIDKEGKAKNVLSVARDVTERKKAEAALWESEERFRELFEQHEYALMLLDPGTCRIINVNSAVESLYGYKKEEIISKDPSLFIEPGEYSRFKQLFDNVEFSENFHIDKIINIRKDGKRIFCAIRGKFIKLHANNVIFSSFHDITEKIRLEEESLLFHAKLIHTNKMTTLGTLVSSVAHEINNPNNLIMFNSQLISDIWQDAIKILIGYHHANGDFCLGGLPFPEIKETMPRLLSGISNGSNRIKDIVVELRDFTRFDIPDNDRHVDINKSILTSLSMIHNEIKKYTENFNYELDENLPYVKGTLYQIEQVIINLIMNSLQALPDKKCRILITTAFDDVHVIIKVKDEGVGMSEEVLKQIGTPFYTTRLDKGGTGLGVSISKSIIHDHNGSLKYESEQGKGTTAIIRLPRNL